MNQIQKNSIFASTHAFLRNRILFLCPYPVDQAASQRFRFEQYLELLEEKKFEFTISSFFDQGGWQTLYIKGRFFSKSLSVIWGFIKRLQILFQLKNFDFIFIHREVTPIGPPIFEFLIAKVFRKRIVYDFDDAIWLPNTSKENKIIASIKWHGKVKAICRWSYKVCCGNSFLADYAKKFNPNVITIPSTIDTVHLHNAIWFPSERKKPTMIVGWTGTHSTLPYILPIIPVLEKLWQKYPLLQLVIIADRDPGIDKPFVKYVEWVRDTEVQELMKFDVGVMPLPDEPWTQGKCGFKALQYMSLEKPALVSPVGVNSQIVEDGVTGFLCSTNEEWALRLEQLLLHEDERTTMGRKGRQRVIDHYSLISNSSKFLSLFE